MFNFRHAITVSWYLPQQNIAIIDNIEHSTTMQVRRFIFLCGFLCMINYGFGCQLSEFMCDTGYCVALDKFCNGNDDCGDKSDEPPYCSHLITVILFTGLNLSRDFTRFMNKQNRTSCVDTK
ncbi:CUB domain-containing protein [Aphis craccivora]|uniref:CUB domain-containing protein n=1 Tax=Aphis craccivora TaxID=307492 RepID=A0A6G0ZC81_APHCR|nr:CUB domain-containing protein [Aphis craccivora]